ncbi:efflux RND transporter permease subunit [Pararhodobacter sp. SW119]|uniref:efflux RND transporter permease subunit n=1 Tax=Pararhodobacter sp. SW119 TaxID=2780075 RepID=UPI001ADFA617|nr:efflux RND transporter permease subunit [Pararhodobacter sp. SW119]
MGRQALLKVSAVGIFRYFTRHRTAANLLLVLMLAAGLLALPRMHAQFFPDIVVDSISVSVAWPGAGAEDVDAGIVQVMEPALLALEGVLGSSARASEGSARITLEFDSGWDMTRAVSDVQDALDLIRTLPEDAEDPRILRSTWADRVTNVVITGPVGVDQLARFADEVAARLFDAGITRTTIQGVAAPEIAVEVPLLKLVEHDLSLQQIAQAIAASVAADPAGDLADGSARVRTGVERRSAEAVGAIVLHTRPDGTTLRVGDVASVQAGSIDRDRAYWVGDDPAISLRVDRSQSGDAIGIQAEVQRLAADLVTTLPEGVRIELVQARADLIKGRLQLLLVNGAIGLGLVVLLLFLFLNARTAFWVAAGIPVAMLAAIAAMYALGMSFNMISLFALIITLGIVVDDAIVVGEHADYRHRDLGEPPAAAAENAATRMALPVFAATITTITAFAGLMVIGGRFGNMIADIPLTVIAVLAASLIECFLILPHHMHHALIGAAREHWYDWPSRQVNRGFGWVRERAFRPLMRMVVAGRYAVLAGLVLLLAVQAANVIRGDVVWRFFVPPEQGTLSGNFVMAQDATRADTLTQLREIQRAADAVSTHLQAEHGTWPVTHVIAELGGNAGRQLAGAANRRSELVGSVTIELIDADSRHWSAFEFTTALQDEVKRHPLLDEISFRSFGMGPGGDSLSVQLFGADAVTLKSAAETLKTRLAPFPEISGLEDSLPYDKEETVLELTPQGRALGFTTDGLARELRHRLSGIEAATFPAGMRSGAIRVELPEPERGADFLEAALLRSASGQYVPLGDIVRMETRRGFSSIQRENGVPVVTVSGAISEDDAARARAITEDLRRTILPRLEEDFGIATRLSGLAEQERDFLSDALVGLIACLLVIYLTLAWVFSSWMRPLVVMAVIPFGLIGVLYGHLSWGMAMSMFSVVGMLGMAGIIINDSIVLVTTVDQYARERGLIPSIVDAACDRLRPVLLTTLTTILGLAPLLFERASQAQFLKPTVVTLVYGLGFGMLLVLLIVPALLAVGHDLSRAGRSFRRALGMAGTSVGPGLRWVPRAALALVAATFAGTLGWHLVTGAPGVLTVVLLPGWTGPLAELVAFAGAATVGLLLLGVGSAAMFFRLQRRAG